MSFVEGFAELTDAKFDLERYGFAKHGPVMFRYKCTKNRDHVWLLAAGWRHGLFTEPHALIELL